MFSIFVVVVCYRAQAEGAGFGSVDATTPYLETSSAFSLNPVRRANEDCHPRQMPNAPLSVVAIYIVGRIKTGRPDHKIEI